MGATQHRTSNPTVAGSSPGGRATARVVGRNNWLVFASPHSGEVASRLYSLVLSCKHADTGPDAYLEGFLQRVSTTPAREIATLAPWTWAKARRIEAGSSN